MVLSSPHSRQFQVRLEGRIKLQIRTVLHPRPSTGTWLAGGSLDVSGLAYWDLVSTQISTCILDSAFGPRPICKSRFESRPNPNKLDRIHLARRARKLRARLPGTGTGTRIWTVRIYNHYQARICYSCHVRIRNRFKLVISLNNCDAAIQS